MTDIPKNSVAVTPPAAQPPQPPAENQSSTTVEIVEEPPFSNVEKNPSSWNVSAYEDEFSLIQAVHSTTGRVFVGSPKQFGKLLKG